MHDVWRWTGWIGRLWRWLTRSSRAVARNDDAKMLATVSRVCAAELPRHEVWARALSAAGDPRQQRAWVQIETLRRWQIWAEFGAASWLRAEGADLWAAKRLMG